MKRDGIRHGLLLGRGARNRLLPMAGWVEMATAQRHPVSRRGAVCGRNSSQQDCPVPFSRHLWLHPPGIPLIHFSCSLPKAAPVHDRCRRDSYRSSVRILTLRTVSKSPWMDRRLPIRFTNRVQGVDRWRTPVEHHGSARLGVWSTSRRKAYEVDKLPTLARGGRARKPTHERWGPRRSCRGPGRRVPVFPTQAREQQARPKQRGRP